MNKIFALLLAGLMIFACCAAMAEETHDDPVFKFNIQMDEIPEGYQFETKENGGDLIAAFYTDDPDALIVYAAVSHSADFDGYTFDHDLTEEEKAQATAALTEDYANPTVEIRETAYGTRLIVVQEDIEEGDYADIVTIWKGYIIAIGLQKSTPITEADIQFATKIVSDMWIVEQ